MEKAEQACFAMTYFSSLEEVLTSMRHLGFAKTSRCALGALRAMGADIKEINGDHGQGYCITGIDFQSSPILGRTQQIDVNTSSQFVTALLLLGSSIKEGLNLRYVEDQMVSKPYISLTINLMRKLGLSVNEHPNQLSITQQQLLPQKIHVEYDWSGVYAFLGGALLTEMHY